MTSNVQEIYRVPLFIKAPGQGADDGEVERLKRAARRRPADDPGPPRRSSRPTDAEFDGQSLVGGRVRSGPPTTSPCSTGTGRPRCRATSTRWCHRGPAQRGLVGDGGWLSLLRVGPAGPLVGQPVASVPTAEAIAGTWEMDQEEQLRDIASTASVRPIAVAGRVDVDDDDPLPTQVLIALDGILAGIGDLDPQRPGVRGAARRAAADPRPPRRRAVPADGGRGDPADRGR